jgi:hypothetical protein
MRKTPSLQFNRRAEISLAQHTAQHWRIVCAIRLSREGRTDSIGEGKKGTGMGLHLPEIIILLINVLWLAAFIDCIVNKWLRRGEKVAWILFLLFANWIGALSYIIYWFGFAKQKRSQVVLPVQSSYVPYQQHDAPSEQNYSPYKQGYQPVRTQATSPVKPFIAERGEQEETMPPFYQQSEVMYPEDPR